MAHRVLLVANRTLGSDEVVAAVRERVEAGATDLWIVAPVAPPHGRAGSSLPDILDPPPDHGAHEEAQERLDDAMDRFKRMGVRVGGEVGDVDAFTAVSEAMKAHGADEVVVSTLPKSSSGWLRADLPRRVQRKFKVPVTTVASHER